MLHTTQIGDVAHVSWRKHVSNSVAEHGGCHRFVALDGGSGRYFPRRHKAVVSLVLHITESFIERAAAFRLEVFDSMAIYLRSGWEGQDSEFHQQSLLG